MLGICVPHCFPGNFQVLGPLPAPINAPTDCNLFLLSTHTPQACRQLSFRVGFLPIYHRSKLLQTHLTRPRLSTKLTADYQNKIVITFSFLAWGVRFPFVAWSFRHCDDVTSPLSIRIFQFWKLPPMHVSANGDWRIYFRETRLRSIVPICESCSYCLRQFIPHVERLLLPMMKTIHTPYFVLD